MTDLHVITIVANDGDIQERVAACAAMKGPDNPVAVDAVIAGEVPGEPEV